MRTDAGGRFTGRHMTAILIAFFAVIIGVNMLMASMAGATFGGVVVENSYVASQQFNRWLDEASAEKALGWKADFVRQDDGRVMVSISGLPDGTASLSAVARHPLGREPDQALVLVAEGGGRFLSTRALPDGRWRVRLAVRMDGRQWRSEGDVQ